MADRFTTGQQERLYSAVLTEVKRLGFRPECVAQHYRFNDWFETTLPERVASAAVFGRSPFAYDSACFAVLLSNGERGRELVQGFRALGAPIAFEVSADHVTHWIVGPESVPRRRFGLEDIASVFSDHAAQWSPAALLRAKNVAPEQEARQLDFFDLGLLPALEQHVREKLDRILREALHEAGRVLSKRKRTTHEPQQLFQLIFRFLTAKVLHDRGVPEFSSLSPQEIDAVLEKVEQRYGDLSVVPETAGVKEVIAGHLWTPLNLSNISVEALAYIYENTLVDALARKSLGTHSTPAAVARYIVRHLPFERFPREERRVLEPCSGHGIFLVAALERLRDLLPPETDHRSRHRHFVKMLHGYEIDAFALEVSKLCLVLADFPNHNGWRLHAEDVFRPRQLHRDLPRARIVLCNPPFEDFTPAERKRYPGLTSVHKPVEVLHRVLEHAHPQAVLGFVLPRQFIDGKGYRAIRERLGHRFQDLEIVALPDRVFANSDLETALLLAREPERSPGAAKRKTQSELLTEARWKLTNRMACSLAEKYSLYTLRHSWATNALERGLDALTVAVLMGHRDPSTLAKVYQHLSHNPTYLLEQARRAVG